ncbi:uncharacterized protein LOC112571604 [Pomacea canaliculata]|uniref:uncharacterized protein LOC112571604 n=1 Tax=Pomacea canaliculata TaxID=400727 RepID=UPI000D72F6AF|nr:uncharacterized protein LOC112571604 [Pomacea canaliculata]
MCRFPWKQFLELVKNDDRSMSGDFEKELWHLEAIGVVRDCRVPCVTFPKADPEGKKTLSVPGDDSNRYICIHPAVLASAICLCLLDDDKKSFRFEAARFWPRDSGFKHPEPQMLSRVIECIPQQGLLRECLLPLFWKEYSLQEEQVVAMLQVMLSLGLLVPHGDQKKLCEGLAMPAFPKLSVQRCYALTLLNLLPDNKPQLNWTAKPFAGDMQVTWRLTLSSPVHHGLLQRLLATVLFAGRADCNYHYVWRTGVLLRIGEATVCAEQLEESHLELSCRVNEADVGREKEAVCVLWVTLAPFLTHVHTFLSDWPGVTYRESLVALGQQFYHDSSVEREPEVGVEHVLTLWQRQLPLIFTDGGTERQLDVALLLPFKPVSMVTSVQAWLTLVIGQTERVLKEAAVNFHAGSKESSSTSPLLLTTLVPKKGPASRGATKYQKKKKSMEVKWLLEESKAVTNSTNSTANGGYLTPGSTTTTTTSTISFTSPRKDNLKATSNGQRPNRVLSDEEEVAETMRLASSFVAAILASALADYVSMEVGNDKLGSSLLSAAQASAARATADAAQAAQTGNIEGAALAVIEAVKAVQVSATGKSEVKVDASPMQSRLCVIL